MNLPRSIHLQAFICFGDLALAARELLAPYLPSIVRSFEMAFQAGYVLLMSRSTESKANREELVSKVIECGTCLCHALSESKECREQLHFLMPKLYEFITKVCVQRANPRVVIWILHPSEFD
jgi:hypothetical protein